MSLASINNPKLAGMISSNSKGISQYADEALKDILREKLNLSASEKITSEDVDNAISGGTLKEGDIQLAITRILNEVAGSGLYKGLSEAEASQQSLKNSLSFFEQWSNIGKNNEPSFNAGNMNFSDSLEYMFGENAFKQANLPFQPTSGLDYDAINAVPRARRAEAFRLRNTLSPDDAEIDTSKLAELGVDQESLSALNDPNKTYKERIDLLNEIAQANKDITDETLKQEIAQNSIKLAVKNMKSETMQAMKQAASSSYVGTFQALGKSLATGADSAELMGDNLKAAGKEMLDNISNTMVNTGLQIAGACALTQNWAGVAGGLALAAAGGLAGGFFDALLSDDGDDDEDDDKTSKLESLADKIADLLEQARIDADYYEKNLRHKTALGINAGYSNKVTASVNDAVITPQGKIISTAPDDYLIATKTPETLASNNQVSVQPKVNIVVNKNTRANVDVNVEQKIEPDGSVQVVAIIEDIVGQYIGSRRSDDAFAARTALLQGVQGIM